MRLPYLILGPLALTRRLATDVAAIGELAREFAGARAELRERIDTAIERAEALEAVGAYAAERGEELMAIGRENAAIGHRMVAIGEATLEQNAHTTKALQALDERLGEVLAFTAILEHDLPAFRAGLETMQGLSESAGALSDVAPPIQAAAERMESIAGRIPGVARRPTRANESKVG
jgi:hypothetical protein